MCSKSTREPHTLTVPSTRGECCGEWGGNDSPIHPPVSLVPSFLRYQEKRRASWSLPPEKEKARRASLGFVNPADMDPRYTPNAHTTQDTSYKRTRKERGSPPKRPLTTQHLGFRLNDIELGQQEPIAPAGGKWEIRTPLRCSYGKLRPAQGGYKGGFAAQLLPCMVRVPACTAADPAACRHSIIHTTRGLPRLDAIGPERVSGGGEGVIPGEKEVWHQMSAGAEAEGDPWKQLVRNVETKARRRRGSQSVPLLKGPGAEERALVKFVDYYGTRAMAAVEKKLRTEWGSGGFSPRFLKHHKPLPRKMLGV